MSVVSVSEAPGSPKAEFALGKYTIDRQFIVMTNSFSDGPVTVTLATGIPRGFESYFFGEEFLPNCRVRSITPEREGNSLKWVVNVHYETPEPKNLSGSMGSQDSSGNQDGSSGDGGGSTEESPQAYDNPLAALTEISAKWHTNKTAVYSVITMNGTTPVLSPCSSTNNEPYDPPPEKDNSILEVSFTRNEPVTSPIVQLAIQYQDAVNSDVFFGAAAGSAKVMSITFDRQTKNYSDGSLFPYLKCCYTFQFQTSWQTVLLDYGTYYWTQPARTGRKQKFLTDDGNPRKGLLAGDGTKLADGGTPEWNSFFFYPQLPFAVFNLPQDMSQLT